MCIRRFASQQTRSRAYFHADTFPEDQQITEIWNGSSSQLGKQVTISNLPYNETIQPNSAIDLGFNGTWNGSNPSPSVFVLNGHICSSS